MAETIDMWLTLSDIHKSFVGKPVLRGINLKVAQGEILVLLGPSGCGKTTLLRTIAGLEDLDAGRIFLGGKDLGELPVHRRGLGMVFQDFALFPHKNVADNVAFGLVMQRWSEQARRDRVEEVLALVGLAGFGHRPVYDLSGGEQQRVALARALAPAPRLLLLDEPLGSLDRALRERLMSELRTILKEAAGVLGRPAGITAIYVTHDQEEAFAIGDRIAVMRAGRIEQVAGPVELYGRPVNAYVARFLGMDNILEATLVEAERGLVQTKLGPLKVMHLPSECDDRMDILIRPGAGQIIDATDSPERSNVVEGQVVQVSFRGRHQVMRLKVRTTIAKVDLVLEFDSGTRLPTADQTVAVALRPEKIQVLECC